MPAPAISVAAIMKFNPCLSSMADARRVLPKRRRFTTAQARDAGVPFCDILWVLSAMARTDKDVERRLRLWLTDCAARVLHIYEKTEASDAPRNAIIAARQYARGEIDRDARAAPRDAARAAARDAGAAAGAAARDAAWVAARAAARDAARDAGAAAGTAAWDAAWVAAWDAAWVAARVAARAAEEAWQFDRLIAWFSDDEPQVWPLPVRDAEAA